MDKIKQLWLEITDYIQWKVAKCSIWMIKETTYILVENIGGLNKYILNK